MIIKGASRRSISFWARHLTDEITNDRVALIDRRGLASESLREMMREMRLDATLTGTSNFMYIASFNPCRHEQPTERQWERMFEIFEHHRGIPAGQQRIVYEHEKHGRIHRHVVWNRIDMECLRAFPDGLDFRVCEAAQRQIERELGMEQTPHLLHRDSGEPPPVRGPKSWEMFRGQRTAIDPRTVTAEVTQAFQASINAAQFLERLRALGYEPCHGDRRAYCLLDAAGDVHSLARRIEGVNTRQLKEFLQGIGPSDLPTLDEARSRLRERDALLVTQFQTQTHFPPRQGEQNQATRDEGAVEETEQGSLWALPSAPGCGETERRSSQTDGSPPPRDDELRMGASMEQGPEPEVPEPVPADILASSERSDTPEPFQQKSYAPGTSLRDQFRTVVSALFHRHRPRSSPEKRARRSGSGDKGFSAASHSLLKQAASELATALDTVYWTYFCNSPDPAVLNYIHAATSSDFQHGHPLQL